VISCSRKADTEEQLTEGTVVSVTRDIWTLKKGGLLCDGWEKSNILNIICENQFGCP
jgi:hypothetical protein